MKRRMLFALAAMCVASVFAAEGAFPRVWTSVSGCRTAEEFEQMAADCVAHGLGLAFMSGMFKKNGW